MLHLCCIDSSPPLPSSSPPVDHPATHTSWDEWVPSSRLLKHNEESHAKQKALIEAARTQRDLTAAAGANAGNAEASTSSGAQSGRRTGAGTKDGKKKGGAGTGGAGAGAGEAGSRKRGREGDLVSLITSELQVN